MGHMKLWQHDALHSIHMRLLHYSETKSFVNGNKCKMYYLSERLQANDFRCHAIYLSELGNKYRSQENSNKDIIEKL